MDSTFSMNGVTIFQTFYLIRSQYQDIRRRSDEPLSAKQKKCFTDIEKS